jgi:DNA gyrase/topoisomerase IV subunit B
MAVKNCKESEISGKRYHVIIIMSDDVTDEEIYI